MWASTGSAGRNEPTPGRTLLYYALPGLVTAIPLIPVFTLVPGFYAEDLGLGLAVTGMVLFIARVLDLLSDPLAGWLSDLLGGAGLRRLVTLGALLGAPGLVLLLSPPSWAGPGWLLGSSLLLYLGWTLVQVPYLTWGAGLSADYHQRTRIAGAREGAVLIGTLLSGALPAAFGLYGLGQAGQLSALAWFAVALGLPVFFLLATRVPDPAARRPARADWRGLQHNRLFLRLLSAWFINGLANGIPAVLFTFYCAHVLAVDGQARNLLLALYLLCAVAGIPLWVRLGARLGRHRAWTIAMLVTCPAFAVASFLGPGQADLFAWVCVITGLCLGADLVLPPAIQADVADWDRLRYRRNRTAGLFSLWNMAAKLALAMAAGITLPLLGGLGLDQPSAPAVAVTALAVIYALLPCVLKLGAVLMIRSLPITPERQRIIALRLQRRDLSDGGCARCDG